MNTKETTTAVVEPEVTEHTNPEAIYPEDDLFKFTIDGTSVSEISHMNNKKFSKEIVESANKKNKLDKIKDLIKNENPRYLNEAKKQILELWRNSERMDAHTSLFTVRFAIAIGEILNVVKENLKGTNEFTKWRDDNFDIKHRRYLQQACKLANMGKFAYKNAPIGKNRLLELDHIRKSEGLSSCYELIKKYIPPKSVTGKNNVFEITNDQDNRVLNHYLHTLITYHKFRENGIDFVTYEQASFIAAEKNRSILVKEVKKIKKLLDNQDGDKKEWFANYLLNKMSPLFDDSSNNHIIFSLNKIMNDFISFCETSDFDNIEWISEQREKIDEKLVEKAFILMEKIINKLKEDNLSSHPGLSKKYIISSFPLLTISSNKKN